MNSNSIRLITQKWREYFSMNYHNVHHKWPKFKSESIQGSNYLHTTLRNHAPLDRSHPDYHLGDWDNIEFSQTFSVPDRFEFSQTISDKATSLDIPQLREACETRGDIGASQDRSVLIQWLRRNYNDPIAFLNHIHQHGFHPDTRVCGVYPKEREGKNKPRMFVLMPMQRRLYIVITEALIGEALLPYFPEITMTFDQTTLFTRLHSVTRTLADGTIKKAIPIVTNIDFEKWNSNMRIEETLRIFSDFDRLFGLGEVFSRSHEVFSQCQFYLADGSITPRWDEDTILPDIGTWSDHLGGMEGMRQKGWTIFTVLIRKHICEQLQIPFQLLGQGDNQVLITQYYEKPGVSIRRQHENFL